VKGYVLIGCSVLRSISITSLIESKSILLKIYVVFTYETIPFHIYMHLKEDTEHSGYYVFEFATDIDGLIYYNHSEYEGLTIEFEDWDDKVPPAEHLNTYREYYLYDKANAYCDCLHYWVGKDESEVILDEWESVLHSVSAGIFFYDHDIHQDRTDYVYYKTDRTLGTPDPDDNPSILPSTFEPIKAAWQTRAPLEVDKYDPAALLPLSDFVDLE
jgi:hypothetical protein